MNQNTSFSLKIVLLSLIFVVASLGVHILRAFTQPDSSDQTRLSPVLQVTQEGVMVKLPYSTTFTPAKSGQVLSTGTEIHTGGIQDAKLQLGQNRIKFQENTTLRILENNLHDASFEEPRLRLRLIEGGIFIDAFDPMTVELPRASVDLYHSSGLITHASSLNRLMVFSGDVNIRLLNEASQTINELVVPLSNQITFEDEQIIDLYATLKTSKLKKELKAGPLALDVLADPWVQEILAQQKESSTSNESHIHSSLVYGLKKGAYKLFSWLSVTPSSQEKMTLKRLEVRLDYLLGKLSTEGDRTTAKTLLEETENLLPDHSSEELLRLLRETLFQTESAVFGTPAYLTRDFLLKTLEPVDGPFLFRVYLQDLRTLLQAGNLEFSEVVLKNWTESWTETKISTHLDEYRRQAQILNRILFAHSSSVSIALLDLFDQTGIYLMSFDQDTEEARFEVIQERLQIVQGLMEAKRYPLAKQYLKNSYFALNIEQNDQSLPSIQIFLETGKLLAQRLDYAEKVLQNKDQTIDEEGFKQYLEDRARDLALTEDLKSFFEEGLTLSPAPQIGPTADQVVERFNELELNLNPAQVTPLSQEGFLYEVKDVTFQSDPSIRFEATYDFISRSVTDVKLNNKTYKGPFLLTDFVTLIQDNGLSEGSGLAESADVSVLISDQQQSEAQQSQAMARDLAIKLAMTQLSGAGLKLADLKSDIQLLDEVNLDKFKILKASAEGMPEKEFISFNYFSGLAKVTDVRNAQGILLFKQSNLSDLVSQAGSRLKEIEQEQKAIESFKSYAAQNDLVIEEGQIVYTSSDLLLLTDLTLSSVNLKATGLYDQPSGRFLSAKNEFLTLENVSIKDFFEQSLDTALIQKFKTLGMDLLPYQIEAAYPFRTIKLKNVILGQKKFDFSLNYEDFRPFNIRDLETNTTLENMSFEELKAYAVDQ